MYRIEISDGIELYNRYLFVPVVVTDSPQIVFDDVTELEPMIDISAVHTECFLFYFLNKYFDSNLEYNKRRITNWRYNDYKCCFEETGAYNFYTYESIKHMIVDLLQAADLLETDYNNPLLIPLIDKFDVHYVHDPDSNVWETGEFGEMKDHASVVSDFYRRIAKHLSNMIEKNPDAFLIDFEYGY